MHISKTYINWVWSIREREIEGWVQVVKNRRGGGNVRRRKWKIVVRRNRSEGRCFSKRLRLG